MPFEMFPRWLCSLKSDTPIIITDLEQIKTEFLEEYRYLEKRSVNSLLAVPFQKRLNAGFLGVDNPKRNVEDPGFLRLVILCIVVELNEILLQEWRERRYASIKQPTIIQANLFGKLEIISATDVLKDDSFTNESGYVLLTFLLLNRKREHPLRLLTDVIWESTDMGNPYNSIKNVVYRLRKTLACIGLRDLIQASHGTFTLNPNYTIFTDVERFDDACKRIDNSSDPAILQALYESIIGLYRGSLLPRYDFYHWLMPKTLYYQNKFLHYMKRYLSMLYREKNYLRVQELPSVLTECLREAKEVATSEYVVANRDGGPLSYTQFKRVWQYIVTRSTKERTYVRYINGQKIQRTVTPKLGEKAAHNGNVVYTLDFQVTPHQLRHTYITNLIYSGADPKTVQYLAGHKHSKITMDIYAKVKYNKPKELSSVVNKAFAPKKGATPNKTRNG